MEALVDKRMVLVIIFLNCFGRIAIKRKFRKQRKDFGSKNKTYTGSFQFYFANLGIFHHLCSEKVLDYIEHSQYKAIKKKLASQKTSKRQ